MMNKKSQKEIIKKPAIDFKVKRNEDDQIETHINFGEGAAMKTTGFKSIGANLILNSTLNVFANLSTEAMQTEGKKILFTMKELNPQDGFEGMLISQMVIVYKQAMDCFHIANDEDNRKSMHIYEKFLNHYQTNLRATLYQKKRCNISYNNLICCTICYTIRCTFDFRDTSFFIKNLSYIKVYTVYIAYIFSIHGCR